VAIRMVGTHILKIETIADLEAALAEPVAMGSARQSVCRTVARWPD
jgi:hypothetical protein